MGFDLFSTLDYDRFANAVQPLIIGAFFRAQTFDASIELTQRRIEVDGDRDAVERTDVNIAPDLADKRDHSLTEALSAVLILDTVDTHRNRWQR